MGRGDLTDAEWERLRPFLPVGNNRCGRWRDHRQGALTLPWNSGVVEGHVNRIKMLKRQMFGRAGFSLLRKRVLLAT